VMPRMGGPDAYLKMCALKPNLPVLFTTGYIAEAASLQALVEKGAGVLQKPYTPTLLGRRVREILVRASGAAGPSRASARLA
jgi:two-component system, cell cycle sensor histidine kinase and response regulator CckA